MNEQELQIVISAVNNAASGLASVQGSLSELSTSASDAAASMTSSLSAAEQTIAEQAQQVADAWGTAAESIDADFEEIVPTTDELIQSLVETNQQAAAQVSTAWQASGEAMEADLAAAMTEIETTATEGGEKAGAAAGDGFGGYFKKTIIGYIGEQIGSFLSGGVDAAVEAAQKTNNQIATLTDQINQQKAAIASHEVALQKWTGTTDQVNAAHQKASAAIDSEKTKIQELTEQLATLQTQQQGLPGQITGIENATLGWLGANKQIEDFIQQFMTTLGPMITGLSGLLIGYTLLQVAGGVLAGMFGVATAAAIPLALAVLGLIAALALLVMAIENVIAHWSQFVANLQLAWTSIEQLVQIGVTAVQSLLAGWGTSLTAWWSGLWNGIVGVLQTAFNTVMTIINNILSAISRVTGAISGVTGAVGGAVGGAFSGAIHAFATGGIVNGPTLALVGEAGPEAIIPLSAFAGGSGLSGGGFGSGGGIVVNVTGNNISSQLDLRNLAQSVGQELVRVLRQNQKLSI